jgi:hypothetical protein
MARVDFLTDKENEDIILSATGEFQFTRTIQESLAQRLGIRLQTWQGTWSYNTAFGTPYTQSILFEGNTKEEVDAIFVSVINQEVDVTSIRNLKSSKDNGTRVYTIDSVEVLTPEGLVDIPVADPNLNTNTYPDPLSFDYFQSCALTESEVEASDLLYKLMNFELALPNGQPDVGTSTWYNLWVS